MSAPGAAFYFDLASPLAYLAAERVLDVLGGPAEWQPVLARELRGPAALDAFRCREEQDIALAQIAARGGELGLQPLRWPDPFPFDSELAMRVATYAKSIGRAVPFAQAAFRQAYAGGHSLQEPDHILIAAAACEMHPSAVLRAAQLRSVSDALSRATERARALGVLDVPAVLVEPPGRRSEPEAGRAGRVFLGERAVEEAAAYMAGATTGAPARSR